MAFDFGDIDGTQLGIPRLMVPSPLLRLMRRKNGMGQAEKWLHQNTAHPWLQPHRVTMYVQESTFSVEYKPVSYFIRCPRFDSKIDDLNPHQKLEEARAARRQGRDVPYQVDPQIAGYTANQLWERWEKPPTPAGMMPPPFPDTVDQADIIELDENDWINYLRDAHKYSKKDTYHCVGPPKFPLYWTATGMAFLDDQEAHDHPDKELLDAMAGDHTRNTRGELLQ